MTTFPPTVCSSLSLPGLSTCITPPGPSLVCFVLLSEAPQNSLVIQLSNALGLSEVVLCLILWCRLPANQTVRREDGTGYETASGTSHLCSLRGRGLFAWLFWLPVSVELESESLILRPISKVCGGRKPISRSSHR